MTFITNEQGEVEITLRNGEEALSFKIASLDGVAFPPSQPVDLPRERLLNLCDTVGAQFGFTREHLVWVSVAA